MGAWVDPLLPEIEIPSDLRERWFKLGSAKFQLLPKQFQFLQANEEFLGYIAGVGSGKTRVGSYKAAFLSMWPQNRGIVGRLSTTDLEATAQRDLLDFLHEAELIKTLPNARTKVVEVYCVDPLTGENLGYTSEISFQHMDDPDHLRGRHIGWAWIDEASEVNGRAWTQLMTRLRLPTFKNRYQLFATGNPKGHNWLYDFFFNREELERTSCKTPTCKWCITGNYTQCNRLLRLKRRGIHCTSHENYFLPRDYLANMIAGMSEEDRLREIEAEFNVFEGQVFKEWREDIHTFYPPEGWEDGRPPREWPRLLAVDVGGATPWCWLWCAVDPHGNLIFYDEIYKTTADTADLVRDALPKMKDLSGESYNFQAKVIDYENRVAAEEVRKAGILLNNAVKNEKMVSVNRLKSYLHPNPQHHFPSWHPLAGQPNSPRMFVSRRCRNLIWEIPQQRYKELGSYVLEREKHKDELDRSVPNHATDCALYITRMRPKPMDLPVNPYAVTTKGISKMSEMYYFDLQREMKKKKAPERRRVLAR